MNYKNKRIRKKGKEMSKRIVKQRTAKRYLPILLALVVLTGLIAPLQAGNQSIVKIGNDVTIETDMRVDDAVAVGGSVYVDGVVDGDAVAVGGSVHLSEEAVVHGDVVTVGGSIDQAEGAMIYGSTVDVSGINLEYIFDEMDISPHFKIIPHGLRFIPIMGLLALVVLLGVIMPNELSKVAFVAKNDPIIMFLYGLLGVVLIVPIAVFLAISIVGIALIPIEIFAVLIAALIGYIAVSIIIGKKLLRALKNDDPNIILSAVLGILILWLVGLIPFFGVLVKIIACTIGFGAVIVTVVRRNKKADELVIEEEKPK